MKSKFIILVLVLGHFSTSILANIDIDDFPELKYLNHSVDPCDDFFEYTCGNFKNFHPRPSDELTIDHFIILQKEISKITEKILTSPNSDEDPVSLKKARAAYKACTDTQYTDLNHNPELSIINEVHGFPIVTLQQDRIKKEFSWNEVGDLISNYGVPLIFGTIQAVPAVNNSTISTIYLKGEAVSFPDMVNQNHDMSHEDHIEHSLKTYAKSKQNLKQEEPLDVFLQNITMKLKAATSNYWTPDIIIKENLDNAKELLRNLALITFDLNIIDDTINPEAFTGYAITLEELQQWTERTFGKNIKLDWIEFMKHVFKNTGIKIDKDTQVMTYNTLHIVLGQIISLVEKTDPDVLKNYCLLRLFLFMASDSDASTRAAFDEYYRKLNKVLYSRPEYCARKVVDAAGTASLSFAVAYEYQRHFFNVNKLSKAAEMVKDISQVFRNTIQNVEWMDEVSKTAALKKVDNMITLLGYPDIAEDKKKLDSFYENIRICKWDNFGNAKRIRAFKLAYQLSQAKGRDRLLWDKSPFDVNAYYTRGFNRIIFPVVMLNPVFFTGKSGILDYARIGSIIGHEITHGFDDNGKNYNEDGIIEAWWSKETQKSFNEKIKCFVDQYSTYFIPTNQGNKYVNGSITLNENLADNGGIREAFKAVQKYLKRHEHQDLMSSKYTSEQLFFIALGTMWCNDPSQEYYLRMLTPAASYPPNKWRVNGMISNMKEFSTAFNCKEKANMNPETRCRLW